MIDENEVIKLCNKYNLQYHIFYDKVLIDSPFKNWICEKRGNIYRLKHINKKTYKHLNHVHNKTYSNLEDLIGYIYKHDTQIVLDRYKKNRLEKLFSQIHK